MCKTNEQEGKDGISPVHAISLASQLLNMYSMKTLTDVTVHCGTESFNLHSPILSHSSGYFHTVLTNKVSSVTLDFSPAVEPTIFEIIIESFYTGTVNGINEMNAEEILYAGYHLEASNVKSSAESFLLGRLNIENALSYWLASRFCNAEKVQKASIELLGRHIDEISQSQVYLELQLDTVVDMLSDENLKVASEQHVYEAAIAWIKYDEEKRSKDLNTILDTVRLSSLPVAFLVSVVGQEDLIENDSVAMSKYSRILKFKLDNKSFRKSFRSLPVEKKRHNALTGVSRSVEDKWTSLVRGIQSIDVEGGFNRVSTELSKLTKSCKEKISEAKQKIDQNATRDQNILETSSGLSEVPEDSESLLSYADAGSNEQNDVPASDSMTQSDFDLLENAKSTESNLHTTSDDEGVSLGSDSAVVLGKVEDTV